MNAIDLQSSSLLVVDAQRGFTTLCPQELPVPGGLAWPETRQPGGRVSDDLYDGTAGVLMAASSPST